MFFVWRVGSYCDELPLEHIVLHDEHTEDVFGAEAGEEVIRRGTVEGMPVEILLDTGSARTLVRRELVPKDKELSGKSVVVRCAHGDSVRYPLADLDIEVEGKRFTIRAGVSEELPVQLLLGRDVPELLKLLCASDGSAGSVSSVASTSPIPMAGSYSTSSVSSVDCTTSPVTRVGSASSLLQSGARSSSPAPSEVSTSPVSGVEGIKQVPSVASTNQEEEVVAVVTRAQARQIDDAATESIITGADFDDDLFEGGRERLRLTRRQKRLERHRYASEVPAELSLKPESKWSGLNMTPAELHEAQLEDPTLEIA